MKVIDAHVHVQPWKMLKPEVLAVMLGSRRDMAAVQEMMYDPGKLLAYMDREGIERVAAINYVSPDIMGFTDDVIDYAADYARRSEGRVLAIGSVHPTRAQDPRRAVEKLVTSGFRGLKLHPAHQACYPNAYRAGNKILETVYREAESAGLVLYVHTGTSIFPGARNVYTDPIHCDDIPIDFPKLKIVLAHGGRPLWMTTAMFLLRRHPTVMMDVSSIPPQKLLEYFPRLEEIADKVLWGSDWPAPG
ncbi:MAG: amidohydrolase, partial [Planctomycetes bacterium]|nr:amidohydrolase [Planctomycetota bacterium]